MSSLTYTWQPNCTPRTLLPDSSEKIALYNTYLKNNDYVSIIQSKDLFWIGAHIIIDLNDPYQKQNKYGFSLKDPVEKIRALFEKNLGDKSDFSIAIISNDKHIHIREDALQIRIDTSSSYSYVYSSSPGIACEESPPKVISSLCPSTEQVLLKDFLPDFIAKCGAICTFVREHRDILFSGSTLCSSGSHYVSQKIDIAHITWNRS